VIACASLFFKWGTVFEPWMKKALELVDGYLDILLPNYQLCPWSRRLITQSMSPAS
jgi:hypothetical protein